LSSTVTTHVLSDLECLVRVGWKAGSGRPESGKTHTMVMLDGGDHKTTQHTARCPLSHSLHQGAGQLKGSLHPGGAGLSVV
jgi:hypothetical protein